MSGHQGVKKTTERVIVHFFWPGVHGDVTRSVDPVIFVRGQYRREEYQLPL